MRILLGIFTCHRYDYSSTEYRDWLTRPIVDRVSAIRDTWLKDVTVDYKFFYGIPPAGMQRTPLPDEVFLDTPDGYYQSAEKIRGVIRYTLDHKYDKLLKLDDDVYAYWDRIIASMPAEDYVGGGAPNIPAGPAYWLSERALLALSKSAPGVWPEDLWVGTALQRAGIHPKFDSRFYIVKPTPTNQYITDEELGRPNDYLTIHALSPAQTRSHYASMHGNWDASRIN